MSPSESSAVSAGPFRPSLYDESASAPLDISRSQKWPSASSGGDTLREREEVSTLGEATSPPRLSIRQIREAAQSAQQANMERREQMQSSAPTTTVPPKKRPSLFGGLFQMKEPTQLALNQVAAQLIAQHGSTSPTHVPNVRLEKMPEHVPKVNSKWDGLPETKKQREQREKGLQKAEWRKSLVSTDFSMRTRDGGPGSRLGSRNSSSTSGSFSSDRAKSVGSNQTSARAKFYAQSVNSSGDLASQQRTEHSSQHQSSSLWSGSHRSVSEISLPVLSPGLADGMTSPKRHGTVSSRADSVSTRSDDLHRVKTARSDRTRRGFGSLMADATPTIEEVPPHSASPVATPPQRSPITPGLLPEEMPRAVEKATVSHEKVSLLSSGPNVLSAPAVARPTSKPINPAFLAGEAQELVLPSDDEEDDFDGNGVHSSPSTDLPLRKWQSGHVSRPSIASSFRSSRVQTDLEQRPVSSRDRLGLQASMLVQTNMKPWPPQGSDSTARSSPRLKFSKSFALFSKDKA